MIELISYGKLHDDPPPSLILDLDLRDMLRDPWHDPRLRELTGLDEPVRRRVLDLDGAVALIYELTQVAILLDHVSRSDTVRLGLACAGGRHRSVVIVQEMHSMLTTYGHDRVTVTHRHVMRPVLQHETTP